MSDTISKEDCSSREINRSEDKIAALKERLAKDRSEITVNGANGNGTHDKLSEMNSKDPLPSKLSNGVQPKEDNKIKLNSSEKFINSSIGLQHTNGNSNKNTIPVKKHVASSGMSYDEEEESIDDEEMEDSSPGGYADDDSSDVVQLDPSNSNSPTPGTSGVKKQLPMNTDHKRANDMSDNEDDEEDIEEVKDSDSDSDIMEVDAEDSIDPPAAPTFTNIEDKLNTHANIKPGKTNIVTIDDMKTLKALADSAKIKKQLHNDKTNSALAEANRLISGRQPGGVTITPAVRNLPPGLTISQSRSGTSQSATSNGGKLPLPAGISVSPATPTNSNMAVVPPSKITDQLNDPNLTDDTFVVEAPSFIVPYVYEKPPKETINDFKLSIKQLEKESKKENDETTYKNNEANSESTKKDKVKDALDESNDKTSENSAKTDNVSKTDSSSPDIKEVKSDGTDISQKKSEFFDSCLGKLFYDLGMNLVQETVQVDLLTEQQRRARKDKSATVMHAIMSLKVNIEQSKERNKAFQMELKKCRFCSFRTESQAVLDHHMETPHMKGTNYRCNVCKMETRTAQEVTSHMFVEHGVRARLERAAAIHQCPQCPFEDNQKGKLTRHKVGCDKRFRGERNQEPPHDWEPPAKIPKPAILPHQKYQHGRNTLPNIHGLTPQQQLVQQMAARGQAGYSALQQQQLQMQQLSNAGMKQMPPLQQMGYRSKGQGSLKNSPHALAQQMRQGGFPMGMKNGKPVYMQSSYAQNQALMQALNQGNNRQQAANQAASMLLPNLGSNSSVTIQSIGSKSTNKSSHSPSISITPLPGGRGQNSSSGKGQGHMQGMKPGQPGNNQGRGFVICEVCDGYIKDMDQLRNHMQWIHKVKIHPKMIHNRPPLNCQKCQYRFFTDQGLERHLLGTHGLVTASMQDLANKGQDSGRCPVCGKVYQWKLLNHVAKDHMKVLKPAHLSYKCTVCTATFGQYKLFENHVYTVHSGAKRGNGSSSSGNKPTGSSQTNPKQPIKVSDEITIIPQKKNTPNSSNTSNKSGMSWTSSLVAAQAAAAKRKSEASKEDPDIIDLDDEEEIDDDEPQKTVQHSANKKGIEIFSTAPSKMASEYDIKDPLEHKQLSKSSNGEPNEKKIKLSELLDDSAEGVEQVEEIDDDEDD